MKTAHVPVSRFASVTANWLNQAAKPTAAQLINFCTASSFHLGGGFIGGTGQMWTPGSGFATALGFYTPQAGLSYNYAFQGPGNTGLTW